MRRLTGIEDLNPAAPAPGVQLVGGWIAVAGPAGLPDPIVRRVNGALLKAMAASEFVERMQRERVLIAASSPEQLAQRVRSDFALVRSAVKDTGITVEE